MLDLGPKLETLEDTVAVMVGLDLLVTIDSGVVHLIGSLGHTVTLLLPTLSDWRRFNDGLVARPDKGGRRSTGRPGRR